MSFDVVEEFENEIASFLAPHLPLQLIVVHMQSSFV